MEVDDDIKHKINQVTGGGCPSMQEHLDIKFTVLKKDHVEASMPVCHKTHQPFGILHGGASVVLAETLASTGAWLNVDEDKFRVAGLEINANHIRPMKEGLVIGKSTPFHIGRTTQVWDIQIENESGKLVCISRCTVAVIPK